MIKRIISSIVMLAIIIPIIVIGGLSFDIAIYLVSILAIKEFIDIKETKKVLPTFMKICCYAMNILMLFSTSLRESNFLIDYRIVAGLFLIFLIPTILYHDKTLYSINDAFYLIGGVMFLSISFSSLVIIRGMNLNIFIYLILITILTDSYALFGGKLIGKHQMIKSVSPNKTWEGTFIGTIFSMFASTVFYINIINSNISLVKILFISLFLSLIGQFGDLVFSSIKRYFGKKDFSNLIPGHGGILDRLDSIIFASLGFMFIVQML